MSGPADTLSAKGPSDSPRYEAATGVETPRLLEGAGAVRSRNMELMAREADAHTRRGFDLAGRQAVFSARAEFIIALRLIAQARDEDRRTTDCSGALAAALTAIEEAEDFLPHDARLEAAVDLPDVIRRHVTTVLQDAPHDALTCQTALRTYLSFAQEQLAAAAGQEVAGSMALYGLGRLHGDMALRRTAGIRATLPKAVVFHQAALVVMPRNYLASNDLGVLLARGGRNEDARVIMEHSLSVHPNSTGWRNLGMVLWQLGRTDLSQAAHRQYLACQQGARGREPHRSSATGQPVRWVDPESFAKLGNRLRNVKRETRSSEQPPRQAYRTPRSDEGRRVARQPARGTPEER